MSILHYTLIALEVVIIFNLIIGVHELGHFLAARWRGLKVDRFAIWFGKPIWKKKIGDVEYVLGTIPFGGYVSLPQMATMETIEGKTDTPAEQLPNVSPLDKIIVAFAGPLFSFLLALAFAALVWQVGRPTTELDNSTTIGSVDPAGPAWKAGLRPGDTIVAIDQKPVHHFAPSSSDSVTWRIVTSTGTNLAITYVRDVGTNGMPQLVTNTAFAVPAHPITHWYERKSLRKLQIGGVDRATILEVATNSPAAKAGLKEGDEVVKLDGNKVYSFMNIVTAEQAMSNTVVRPMTLSVVRDGKSFECTMTPVKPLVPTNSGPSLGIVSWRADTNVTMIYPAPMDQIQASATQIFNTLGALFEPKGEIGVQQLGGAVMIGRVYYNLLQDEEGWRRVLWFSVILNVNLALLNMLPLPVLDGGHILLSLIEAVRRRPVSGRLLEKIQSGFAALLIVFMLYIAFFDIGDWVRSARADREVPVVFAPQK